MKHHLGVALAVACALLLALAPGASAGISGYLKFDGIDGESQAKGHEGEMDIASFSWDGVQRSHRDGGGPKASRVSLGDISFVKQTDKSSPRLMVAAASGRPIACGVLTLEDDGEAPSQRLRITFEDLVISHYGVAGARGGDAPMDTFSVDFARMEMSVASQDPAGDRAAPTTAGWDFLTRSPFESRGCA